MLVTFVVIKAVSLGVVPSIENLDITNYAVLLVRVLLFMFIIIVYAVVYTITISIYGLIAINVFCTGKMHTYAEAQKLKIALFIMTACDPVEIATKDPLTLAREFFTTASGFFIAYALKVAIHTLISSFNTAATTNKIIDVIALISVRAYNGPCQKIVNCFVFEYTILEVLAWLKTKPTSQQDIHVCTPTSQKQLQNTRPKLAFQPRANFRAVHRTPPPGDSGKPLAQELAPDDQLGAILWLLCADIRAGPLQVRAGHEGGAEAAIHAMRRIFREPAVEGVLLIENTILNKKPSILCNITLLLVNFFWNPPRLVRRRIAYGNATRVRDPLAKIFNCLITLFLIRTLHHAHPDTKQVWNVDTATVAGSCGHLRSWWDSLSTLGPRHGIHPKHSVLIVKPEFDEVGKAVFMNTSVTVTSRGHGHLGAVLGAEESRKEYVSKQVEEWIRKVKKLADRAANSPHRAYSEFHSMAGCWSFLTRTIPDIQHLLLPLEQEIRHKFLPALTTCRDITDTERRVFALPVRLGGLGIADPSSTSQTSLEASVAVTTPLVNAILEQDINAVINSDEVSRIKNEVTKSNRQSENVRAEDLERELTLQSENIRAGDLERELALQQKRSLHLAVKIGSSSWLTGKPEVAYMSKEEFGDALDLRYDWITRNLPQYCNCGHASCNCGHTSCNCGHVSCKCDTTHTVDHAHTCKRPPICEEARTEVRDATVSLLEGVCHHVTLPPGGEPDIRASGLCELWRRKEDVFLHITVFHPNAPSQRSRKVSTIYHALETSRRRKYDPLVWEHGTFTPLVFSTSGGMGKEADRFYRQLARVISKREGVVYSEVIRQIRTRMCFAILHASIKCLHDSQYTEEA